LGTAGRFTEKLLWRWLCEFRISEKSSVKYLVAMVLLINYNFAKIEYTERKLREIQFGRIFTLRVQMDLFTVDSEIQDQTQDQSQDQTKSPQFRYHNKT
jgi:hypothetical protein